MYKPYDFEPVLVYGINRKTIISRFHWKLATVWFEPKLVDSRPNVAFIKGFHTPIVQLKDRNYVHFLAMDSDAMNVKEKIEIAGMCSQFEQFIKKPEDMFLEPVNYEDVISNDPVDKKYHLILNTIKGFFFVGPFDPESLPKEFQNVLNYKSASTNKSTGPGIYS